MRYSFEWVITEKHREIKSRFQKETFFLIIILSCIWNMMLNTNILYFSSNTELIKFFNNYLYSFPNNLIVAFLNSLRKNYD